ncbi:RICIN domain-containing protein [Ferruginibacter sp.]
MRTTILCLYCIFFACTFCIAQDNNYGVKGFNPKTFTVTDSLPVTYNGLTAGYTIKDESEKSVGKKGDFSRFKIYFYLTNTGTEAKIMYRNMDFGGHAGPINNNIALFKCLNATGARFTNKMATMELQPCKIEANVEDKDCSSGKVITSKRVVDLGYWIKPGETVSKTYPMIVPLNEKPKVTVTFYAEVGNQTGTFIYQTNATPQQAEQVFVRIKNATGNAYLHNQNGPLSCTGIDNDWWSAQWEILPVGSTGNFQIRNRWKGNYLSSSNAQLLSDDGQSPGSVWIVQETSTADVYYIKNAVDNARLYIDNGVLKLSSSFISNDASSKWIIEK